MQSLIPSSRPSVKGKSFSQENIGNFHNGRKRPIESNQDDPTALNEWKNKNKRKRLSSFEQHQYPHQTTEEELTEIRDCRVRNLQFLMKKK